MIYAISLLDHVYFVAATEAEAQAICALSPMLTYERVEFKGSLLQLLALVDIEKRKFWKKSLDSGA